MRWGQPTGPGSGWQGPGVRGTGGVHLPATGAQALVRVYDKNSGRVVVRTAAGINTVADMQGYIQTVPERVSPGHGMDSCTAPT